jgi:hypothetical protein
MPQPWVETSWLYCVPRGKRLPGTARNGGIQINTCHQSIHWQCCSNGSLKGNDWRDARDPRICKQVTMVALLPKFMVAPRYLSTYIVLNL